jgi:hypothetical protein
MHHKNYIYRKGKMTRFVEQDLFINIQKTKK